MSQEKKHTHSVIPDTPVNMPRAGGRFRRWLGRTLLRLSGWRLIGEIPNNKKLILAAAPHTSNWDFILAMLVVMALGVRVSYLMKKEAFIWPFATLFKHLGGIPLDRHAAEDTVEQIAGWYRSHEKVWVVITPEGTRSKVDKWKTGFLRIAAAAEVPVHVVAWDYPTKTMIFGPKWQTTGDHVNDAQNIRDYLTDKYRGRIPDNQ